MKSFGRLVEDKNRVTKDCDDFIKELKTVSLSDDSILTLIKLLSKKKKNYTGLSCDNYKKTAFDLEELNEKIYRQIVLLEKQNIQDIKLILEKFSSEYKDQRKIKLVLKQLIFIKNHYKSLIVLLGLTPFIIYFIFNKSIGYIPISESGDIFSLLVALALSGFSLLFMLYLMPMMQLFFLFYIRDIKGTGIIYATSVFLFILFVF